MCKAEITEIKLEHRDTCFYIEAGMLFLYDQVGNNSSQIFIPVLFADHHHVELPSMLVAGKHRYWSLVWALRFFNKDTLNNYRIRKILKAVNGTSINYMYRIKLDYEPWMDKARIRLTN